MSRIFFKDGGLRGGRYEGAVGLSLTLALLGFAGFFLKNTGWRWRFLSLTGLLLSLGPNPVINNISYPFPLPYHWLKNVPLFSFNRVPCRFADLVLISFCVMGSTALSGWMQRSRHPKRIFIPIQGLLLFELLFAPMKIVKHPVPLTLQTLACMKDDRALFHVDYKGAILMYYQTFHHHRINGGFSARIADRDLSKQQELLERVALQYCLKQDDIIDRRAAMDYVWKDLGYGYLMVPKRWEMVTEPVGGPIEEQLKKLLTYPVLAEDEDYVIFVLPDRSDSGPVLEMNRGWNEPVEGIRGRKLSHENRLIVRNPENIPAGILLELEVLPPAGLKVLLDGNLVFHREYPGGLPSRTEQVRIDAGLVRDGSVLSICSEHNPDAASGSPAGIVLKNAGITDESGPH